MSQPAVTPIADLSYRNYDGPLRNRAARWWIVALSGIRIALRRWYFWLFVAFAGLPPLFVGFGLYLMKQQQGMVAMANPMAALQGEEQKTVYAEYFFRAFDGAELWFFAMALAVGAGAIASDMRANALLVYLSKPIARWDYLAGKWFSVFVPVYLAGFIPALLLYLFCFFSYNAEGFFKNEPYLLPQVLGCCAIPAALHASLVLLCSAWSRSGRLAGAVYAAVYFISNTVALILFRMIHRMDFNEGYVTLHASVSGIVKALWQSLLDVTIKDAVFRRRGGFGTIEVAPHDGWLFAGIAVALIGAALALTWVRIRAVEVVRG